MVFINSILWTILVVALQFSIGMIGAFVLHRAFRGRFLIRGLAILPWYVARESIAGAIVRPALTDHGVPAQDMHAVFPSPKLVPSKVTSFIDFLQHALDGDWWLRAA